MMKEAFRERKTETKCTHQGEYGKTSRKLKTKRRKEDLRERPEKAQLPKRRARQNEAGMETIGKEEGGEES
jgi:hypothetical protein